MRGTRVGVLTALLVLALACDAASQRAVSGWWQLVSRPPGLGDPVFPVYAAADAPAGPLPVAAMAMEDFIIPVGATPNASVPVTTRCSQLAIDLFVRRVVSPTPALVRSPRAYHLFLWQGAGAMQGAWNTSLASSVSASWAPSAPDQNASYGSTLEVHRFVLTLPAPPLGAGVFWLGFWADMDALAGNQLFWANTAAIAGPIPSEMSNSVLPMAFLDVFGTFNPASGSVYSSVHLAPAGTGAYTPTGAPMRDAAFNLYANCVLDPGLDS